MDSVKTAIGDVMANMKENYLTWAGSSFWLDMEVILDTETVGGFIE